MVIIFSKMIRNTRETCVDVRTAEILRSDIFARGGFDERRSTEEDRARTFDDDGFIAHGRDVRAARRARAHYRRDLRNLFGRHARLVVEDATEMIEVGKDFVLQGQKRPARIDEIQAGQIILFGDLLSAQMLLDRHREVRPTFDSGIVGDDEHFAVADASNTSNYSSSRSLVIVEISRGKGRKFQERRARVKQAFYALTDKELALLFLSLTIFLAASFTDAREALL